MKKLTKKEEQQVLEIKRFERKKNHNHKKGDMLKMAKKTQEEFKYTDSEGKETVYEFQYPGFHEATKILDRSKNAIGVGFISENLYKELMEHIIVKPKTNWNYWEENEGATEVLQAAQTFLTK